MPEVKRPKTIAFAIRSVDRWVSRKTSEKTIALPIRSLDPSLFAQLIALPNLQELEAVTSG